MMVLFETFYFSIAAFHRFDVEEREASPSSSRMVVVMSSYRSGGAAQKNGKAQEAIGAPPLSQKVKTVGIV